MGQRHQVVLLSNPAGNVLEIADGDLWPEGPAA